MKSLKSIRGAARKPAQSLASTRMANVVRTPHVMTVCAIALAGLVGAGSAIAQSGSATQSAPAGQMSSPGSSRTTEVQGSAAARSQVASADRGMLRDIAEANIAEIATARIALDKSQSAQVKEFAQMMIDDHGSALKEVQQLAQSKGVDLPDEPSIKHKTVATALKALSGDAFDKQYMSQAGLGDHRKTHELLVKTQSRAKDADLKALAAKMQPVVDRHLQHAEQMASAKSGGKGQQGKKP